MKNSKLFISYSWSSNAHEQWVLELATQLMESGIDVVFDKWDLKEGHDANAFMEKMVTDPEIKKVAMIVDQTYAEKADGRNGGVGTETQIISKKVYESQAQDKFVAITVERDESGKPYLPTYYGSRKYIDFSKSENYESNFEQLLRWITDKPLYQKPEIGRLPEYISKENPIQLSTSSKLKRAVDLLKNDKPNSLGAVQDYLEAFKLGLDKFRIVSKDDDFDEHVIRNIEEFIPYRREFLELVSNISKYGATLDLSSAVHRFIEGAVSYTRPAQEARSYKDWDFDNFKFILHELYLNTLAILIKDERFEQAANFMEQRFYVPGNSDFGREVMSSFSVLNTDLPSLKWRNQRLKLNKLSLHADLLKERAEKSGQEFQHLMQADFVLFMRSELEGKDWPDRWWPETLVYVGRRHSPFEIFARATSKKYFDRIRLLLMLDSKTALDTLVKDYVDGTRKPPSWDAYRGSFNPVALLNHSLLCTTP